MPICAVLEAWAAACAVFGAMGLTPVTWLNVTSVSSTAAREKQNAVARSRNVSKRDRPSCLNERAVWGGVNTALLVFLLFSGTHFSDSRIQVVRLYASIKILLYLVNDESNSAISLLYTLLCSAARQ